MTTKIFKSYGEFLSRENKLENGVSEQFALDNPNFEKDNEDNEECWNCSGCSDCSECSGCSRCSECSGCSRCSECSGCSRCSRCSDCSECSGCSGCSRCSDCSECSGCSGCSRCSDCSECSGCSECSRCSGLTNNAPNIMPEIPVIENIHQRVLEAVSEPSALNMETWHTCDTTHCRAGWVEVLAGEKGKALAKHTSTLFAAQQIYKASSPNIKVSPVRFFEPNEKAMADIVRCAQEEKALIK